MKYKTLGIIACIFAFLIGIFNWQLIFDVDSNERYHQHIQAEKKEECNAVHSNGELCTHLPIISIDTNGVEIPGATLKDENGKKIGYTVAQDGSDRIKAHIDTFDSQTEYNHIADTPNISSDVTIHVRGNSSRSFDKQGYSIKLINEDGTNNPQSLLGMDAHQDWALHGPFIDKTLIRNYMWYNIAGEIMDYSPNVRFCEVVLNGEYMGVYVLVEKITAGKDGSRLNLTIDEKDNTFSGYVLLLDRGNDAPIKNVNSFTKYALRTKQLLSIEYPGMSFLDEESAEKIRQDFSDFEKMLYSYDFDNEEYGYKHYIDVDSFVDYFLINEFTCNYDAGWLSTYIYKDLDGKYRMCIWDFNSACDNYQETQIAPNVFEMHNCLWYVMLLKDEYFTDKIISRYHQLRKTYFNTQYLNDYIDDCIEYLGPAIERNFQKWGYTFDEDYDVLIPTERNPRSYEAAVKQMKDFIDIRGEWMDENIESLSQYSKDSKIKKFDENAN